MAFISKEDLGQDIYDEILKGVTRANDDKITTACAEAQDEINGYLCARYDTADLFAKTADQRNKTIMAIARTIAIYKLHKACNTMPQLIRIEFEDAVTLLGKIQSGKFIIEGAKLVGQTDTYIPETTINRSGNTKRNNYM
jgi:phage gp36-like protein